MSGWVPVSESSTAQRVRTWPLQVQYRQVLSCQERDELRRGCGGVVPGRWPTRCQSWTWWASQTLLQAAMENWGLLTYRSRPEELRACCAAQGPVPAT